MFKHSIFLRIYAGLVILVVLVAVFGYLLVQIINYQRAQEYRESLTDGMAYIISEGVARQPNLQQKMDWVSDASDLLELPIHYVEASKVDITRAEGRRIADRKAVVRWDAKTGIAYIVVGLRDDPNHYLYIKADSITERQMKRCRSLFWIIWSIIRVRKKNICPLFRIIFLIRYRLKTYRAYL